MSKFATLALLGAACAEAHYYDHLVYGDQHPYHVPHLGRSETERHHYVHHDMPPSREGAHLAFLLGMDSNGISPEQSNSLDELAAAMIDKNVEYAEDLLDRQSEELPTFHVVHEQENALDPTPSPSRSPRRKGNAPEPSPQHMTLN